MPLVVAITHGIMFKTPNAYESAATSITKLERSVTSVYIHINVNHRSRTPSVLIVVFICFSVSRITSTTSFAPWYMSCDNSKVTICTLAKFSREDDNPIRTKLHWRLCSQCYFIYSRPLVHYSLVRSACLI